MVFQRGFAVQLLVIVLVLYALLVGGTFNGLVSVEISRVSLIMLAGGLVGWLVLRHRRGHRWHFTPLDPLILAGLAVLILTTLPNLESWRRIAMGAWYWGVYLLIWWLVADLVANGLPRRWVVNALLVAGWLVIVLGYLPVVPWLREWVGLQASGVVLPFSPPRPSSVVGNPNGLGTILIVVILLALGRAAQTRNWLVRAGWGVYILAGGGLLFLSLSRGAWVGAMLGGVFWLAMLAADAGMLSLRFWRERWQQAGALLRVAAVTGLVAAVAVVVVGGLAAVRIANQPGRGFETTRAIVYNAALEEFSARPLTGSGLFTFGKQLLQYHSTPPQTPHSHAHNLFLHAGVQLGLPGLLALGWGIVLVSRGWWRRWQRLAGPARLEHMTLGAALVAIAGHHMFDITTMMPALALMWLLLLACALLEDAEARAALRRWQAPLVLGMALLVLGTGWWSQMIQQRYFAALRLANSGAWREGAAALEDVVRSDSDLALYAAQQGYVWGVAAYRGDDAAVEPGITALERALAAEDGYAPWHANLAALHRQAGDIEAARTALREALVRAPLSGVLWLNLGAWAEADGDLDEAREAYARALEHSGAFGLAFWAETPLRQEAVAEYLAGLEEPLVLREAVVLLADEAYEAAVVRLLESPGYDHNNLWWRVMVAVAYEGAGETAQADRWFQSARLYQQTGEDAIWLTVGEALLAVRRGSLDAPALVEAARQYFVPDERGAGFAYGENLAWFNFYRGTFSPQFLPQLEAIPSAWKAQYALEALAR